MKAGDRWVSCTFGNVLSIVLCAFVDKVFGLYKSMSSGQLITSGIHCKFMFAKGGFAETIDPPRIGHTFVYLKKNLLTSWFDPPPKQCWKNAIFVGLNLLAYKRNEKTFCPAKLSRSAEKFARNTKKNWNFMNTVKRLFNKPKRVLDIQTLKILLKLINHSHASFLQAKLEPHSNPANPNSNFVH